MSFTEGSQDGTLNNTTEVDIVSSPASSTRRVTSTITINNRDTAAVTLTVKYVNGSNKRTIWSGTLQSGDTWESTPDIWILVATNQKIVAVLGGTVATTQPDFVSSYADVT